MWLTKLWKKSKMSSITIADWLWMNFLQIFATWNPRILETVCHMGPKTADRPTQVKSSGGQAIVFETLQTPWRWISPLHRYWRWNLDVHGWKMVFNWRGGGEADKGVGRKLLRGWHKKINTPVSPCALRGIVSYKNSVHLPSGHASYIRSNKISTVPGHITRRTFNF